MELTQFITTISSSFEEKNELDGRMKFAEGIANQYKFKFPALVLLYTHPKFSRMPISERCKTLGLTEEQYLLFSNQEGFQKFVKDFHSLNLSAMRTQAMESVGKALQTDRYTYDRDGNEMVNHQLEVEILKGLNQERQGPQVAVQVNNLWGAAKQRRLVGKT